MGFFAQFFTWLNAQVAGYVGTNTALVASAIEPAAVTLATIYVMFWGFMSLTGRIQEPIWEGVKRIIVIALILGIGIRLWTYNTVIVDTFFNAPDQLAARIIGSPSTVGTIDQIWMDGQHIAEQLLSKGSILNGDFSYYIAGFVVYLLIGLTVVVTAFLLALSKVALAIILTLGPIFIVMLFFDATKRFFESWIAQLSNYALITVLTLLVAAFLLSVLRAYTTNAVALGSGITIAESVRVCVISVLVFLVMRQVMPIAAGLASGIALSSYGVISGAIHWGIRGGTRSGYEMGRGVMDGMRGDPRSRWDTLRRGASNRVGAGVASLWRGVRGNQQGGSVMPRERVMPWQGSSR